jgi:hypothetical protein
MILNPLEAPSRQSIFAAIGFVGMIEGVGSRGHPVIYWVIVLVVALPVGWLIGQRLIRQRRHSAAPGAPINPADIPVDAVAALEKVAFRKQYGKVNWRYFPCPLDPAVCVRPECADAAVVQFGRLDVWLGHRLPRDPAQLQYAIAHEARHFARVNRFLFWAAFVIPMVGYFSAGRWLPGWWSLVGALTVNTTLVCVCWADELICDRAGVRAAGAWPLAAYLTHGPRPDVDKLGEWVKMAEVKLKESDPTRRKSPPGWVALAYPAAAIYVAVTWVSAKLWSTHPPTWLRIWYARRIRPHPETAA